MTGEFDALNHAAASLAASLAVSRAMRDVPSVMALFYECRAALREAVRVEAAEAADASADTDAGAVI